MIRPLRLVPLFVLLVLAAPAPGLQAQALAAVTAAPAPGPGPGPRYENLRAGLTVQDQAATELQLSAAAKGPFGSKKNGKIAMIVGGAALVGGLIVGDDAGYAIAIGGLVVGLLGLWTYLA